MKMSLRTQKVRKISYVARSKHNRRMTISETVTVERIYLNDHKESEHNQPTLDQLWTYIRADFDKKKEDGLIDTKRRFLKRNSTKVTKDVSGKKTTDQIETSIVREFVFQIGNEHDNLGLEKSREIYQKAMEYIEDKYKMSMLSYDFHADETTPHAHCLMTTYNFKTGEFSKKFNDMNSYGKMQEDLRNYIQKLVDVEIEELNPKSDCKIDYISPVVYRRNKKLLDTAREYCHDKEQSESTIDALSITMDQIQDIIGTDFSELKHLPDVVAGVQKLKDENEELVEKVNYLQSMHSKYSQNNQNKAREAILNENEGKSSPKAFSNEYEHLYSEVPEIKKDGESESLMSKEMDEFSNKIKELNKLVNVNGKKNK